MLSKQTVLITGGSSGIGLELARQMLEQGHRVLVCGRSRERLERAQAELNGLEIIECDVTSKQDREELLKLVERNFSELSMLINNAGIVKRFWIQDVDDLESMLQEEWNTNYFAPISMIHKFHELLKQNGGSIVNISSGLAHVPLIVQPNYCATKAALHSMSMSLRMQLKEDGIRVIEVFPPAVDTPFQDGHAPAHAISAREAGKHILKGLSAGKNEIMIKQASLLYFMSRLMPRMIFHRLNSIIPADIRKMVKLHNQNSNTSEGHL